MIRRLVFGFECHVGKKPSQLFSRRLSTPNGMVTTLCPVIAQLHEDEIDKAYFQQDGATAHTAHMSTALLDDVFADRIISKTIWPPRSPDLSPSFFFFLWGAMKNSLYSNNPHTIDDLKMAITEHIRNVDRAIVNTVLTQFGVSINVWRLAEDTFNITCNLLYCNHQAHRDFLITLHTNDM